MVTADVPGAESTFLALKWKMLSGFTGSASWFQIHEGKHSQVPGAVLTVDLQFSHCLNITFPLSAHGFSTSPPQICRILFQLQGNTFALLIVVMEQKWSRSESLWIYSASWSHSHCCIFSHFISLQRSNFDILDTRISTAVGGISRRGWRPCLTAPVPGCLFGMGSRQRHLGDGCFHWG